jgi:phospholipid-binding lipoprotein MlaA
MRKILLLFIAAVLSVALFSAPSFSEGPEAGLFQIPRNTEQQYEFVQFQNPSSDDAGKAGNMLIADAASSGSSDAEIEEDEDYLEEEDMIADPLEPINRAFFTFNDRLYFWVLKPVAQGYAKVVPEGVRTSIRNFFDNLMTPVRFVNSVLQLKFEPAGNELVRFGVNSTIGMLGLFDVAREKMGIGMQDEDFGQTLGKWGLGPGFYINWPILGPSSLRDTIGYAGDYFLDPVNYVNPLPDRYAIRAGDKINRASFKIGDYEAIKKESMDPYSAIRDIYYQYRESRIER